MQPADACARPPARALDLLASWPHRPNNVLPNGVPKIVHQTWKTVDVPTAWASSRDSWRRLHPDWLYVLWTDADIEAYIKSTRPELWAFMSTGLKWPIQRVDLWRYVALHDFGGIYSDLDIEPVKDTEEALSAVPAAPWGTVYLVPSANMDGVYTNAFMISSLGADAKAFWASLVSHCTTWREDNSAYDTVMSVMRHMEIMLSTGPLALTRVANRHNKAVVVLPRTLWNPYSTADLAGGATEDPTTYAPSALVKILPGSSWHDFDSAFLGFFNEHRTATAVMIACIAIYVAFAMTS